MDDAWQAKGDVGLATRNIDKLKAKDEVPNDRTRRSLFLSRRYTGIVPFTKSISLYRKELHVACTK